MIKLTLKEKDRICNNLVPETKTIRQVLIENHMDYSAGNVYVNALPVQPSGLDTPFSHISDEATHYVISVSSPEHGSEEMPAIGKVHIEDTLFQTSRAPKVYLISSVCVIVSSLTAQEISNMKHSKPDLLQSKDENNEPFFAIDVESGYGSLKEYGAVYSDHVTCEGKATITILLDATERDLSDVISNKLGMPFYKLVQLEKQILAETHGIPIDNEAEDFCFTQI